MSTDPFDEAPHDPHSVLVRPVVPAVMHRPTASSDGAYAPLSPDKGKVLSPANFGRNDPHANTERAMPNPDVLHRRGLSIDANDTLQVPLSLHHGRSRSSDIDDHMAGSVFAPHEKCPKCGFARGSSVYCPVSKLHHGTEEPMSESKPRHFFDRFRRATSDEDEPEEAPEGPPVAEPSTEALVTDPTRVSHAATTPSKRKGWSLFKTKEEKECIALEGAEEAARALLMKGDAESERSRFEAIASAFATERKEIHRRDKARNALVKDEMSARDSIVAAEERARRDASKDAEKARSKLPSSSSSSS